jgi:hypothetical protein
MNVLILGKENPIFFIGALDEFGLFIDKKVIIRPPPFAVGQQIL